MHKRIFIAVVTYVTHSCGSLLLQRLCTMMKFSLWFIGGDGHLRIISVKLKLFFKTKLNLFLKDDVTITCDFSLPDLNCNGYRHFPPQLTLGRYPGKIVIRIAIYTKNSFNMWFWQWAHCPCNGVCALCWNSLCDSMRHSTYGEISVQSKLS